MLEEMIGTTFVTRSFADVSVCMCVVCVFARVHALWVVVGFITGEATLVLLVFP